MRNKKTKKETATTSTRAEAETTSMSAEAETTSTRAEAETTPTSAEALRGTLDLLVLKTLSLEPMHGWGITQLIRERSRGLLDVNQGSLYPALQRLEGKGLVVSEWQITENNRRARFYRLTASGRAQVAPEEAGWRRHVEGVSLVLGWDA